MAMITGSVRPQQRGGFMSANSSIQHICSGIGAYVGGLIIVQAADGTMATLATLLFVPVVYSLLRTRAVPAAE